MYSKTNIHKVEFFRQIVEFASDSIVAIDTDLKIIFFNKEAEKTFGYSSDEILGKHLNTLIPSRFHESHNNYVTQFAKSGVIARLMNETANLEVMALRRDGSEFFVEISIIKIKEAFVSIVRDITNRKAFEEKLKFYAERDYLTGVMNRRKTEETGSKELERAKRFNNPFSILVLDIDHFKKINDSYGHDIGDLAIIHLTSVVQNVIRQIDSIGRWGGEEFVILLPEVDDQGISVVAEKIRSAVEQQPFITKTKKNVDFTISIGGSTYSKSNASWESILKNADLGLYKAKKNGRNRFCYYDS